MIEYLIEEIRHQLRKAIESAIHPIKRKLKKILFLWLFLVFLIMPFWLVGIYFLVTALFLHFLGSPILVHSALMAAFWSLLIAVVDGIIAILIVWEK